MNKIVIDEVGEFTPQQIGYLRLSVENRKLEAKFQHMEKTIVDLELENQRLTEAIRDCALVFNAASKRGIITEDDCVEGLDFLLKALEADSSILEPTEQALEKGGRDE